VRLLALFLLIGFAVDPLLYLVASVVGKLSGLQVILGNLGFMAADLAVALASAGMWWVA
jgi:hypothetical protein